METVFGPNDSWTGVFVKRGDDMVVIDVNEAGLVHRSIDHLFITHPHTDHCHFHSLSHIGRVYATREAIEFLDRVARERIAVPDRDKLTPLGRREVVGDIEVEPVPVFHNSIGCVGYYVECPDVTILVTGDWCGGDDETIDRLAGYEPDVIICDGTICTNRSVPDSVELLINRLELVRRRHGEDIIVYANWQAAPVLEAVSEVFGEFYCFQDDPITGTCDLLGVDYNEYDGEGGPVVTSYTKRYEEWAEAVAYELMTTPSTPADLPGYMISRSFHPPSPDIKLLVEQAEPELLVMHHANRRQLKVFRRHVSRVVNCEIWPKEAENPKVLAKGASEL